MTDHQGKTLSLIGVLVLVVIVVHTTALDWLSTVFTYRPFQWNLNPLSGLSIQTPLGSITGPSGAGSSGSGGSSPATASGSDSGSHQALTSTGQTYTVSGTYAGATQQQQADMNRYAQQVGNAGG